MSTQNFRWQGIVSKYAYAETWRSLWQIFNSIVPFFVLWYLMFRSLEVGYWLTLLLAVHAAADIPIYFYWACRVGEGMATERRRRRFRTWTGPPALRRRALAT